jgi:catechol 2,3-dioxygenase-like lactoylglutathione lyase family enzyme
MSKSNTQFKQVFQLGIVVRDVDASIEKYKSLLGVPNEAINVFETKNMPSWLETKYRGQPSQFHVKIALLDFGGLQFELIEPIAGDPSVYSEFLEKVGQGIQHIMVKPVNHDRLIETLEQNGSELINRGMMYGGEFRYYDLTEDLGFVLELFPGIPDEYVRNIVTTGMAGTESD